jgi:hypothetical protein
MSIFTPSLTLKDLNSKDKPDLMDEHVHAINIGFANSNAVAKPKWYKFIFDIVYLTYYSLFTVISLLALFLVLIIANALLLFRKKEKDEKETTPFTF